MVLDETGHLSSQGGLRPDGPTLAVVCLHPVLLSASFEADGYRWLIAAGGHRWHDGAGEDCQLPESQQGGRHALHRCATCPKQGSTEIEC